jgi:ATP-dependent DNA helicase RecG
MSNKSTVAKKLSLDDPLQFIKGVGPKRADLLKKINLETVSDALFFLPFRYEDRTQVKKIIELVPGETASFLGEVVNAGTVRIGRRRKIFEALVQDDSGFLHVKWFQFNETYMTEKVKAGRKLIFSGKPTHNKRGGGLEIIHPNTEIQSDGSSESLEIGRIVPIYHSTDGLHLKSLRKIMKNLVDDYKNLIEEFLPEKTIKRHKFPTRSKAIQRAHFPPNDASIELLDKFQDSSQARLIFEEFFLLQLTLALKKRHLEVEECGQPFKTRGEIIHKFMKLLKFDLTKAQKKVLGEIMNYLEKNEPMNLLLQGDVGSGKTVVALISLLTGVDNDCQTALMAPTELLAEQHFLSIRPFCEALNITITLVTSSGTAKEKSLIHSSISNGTTQIIVGTHALIQKKIEFSKLGLIVVDEQHRFGVLQRDALSKKGLTPHVLIMTATPIPRSLALTLYGDMNVSFLDEFPPGRIPIDTKLFYEDSRINAYTLLEKEITEGRQAYVVCPLIEESESVDLKAAIDVSHELQSRRLPNFKIELLHGKLKKEERQKIMAAFKNGEIDVLVATTVIEVGIDVPNATVMLIEHAERFGLAQLHQLRGRVGRGKQASICLLICSHALTDDGKARLSAIVKSRDGFSIAEEDLRIRGPGDFTGTRQSGMPLLRAGNLLRDIKLLELSRREAIDLIEKDPKLEAPEHIKLKDALHHTFGNQTNLMKVI